MFFFVASNFVCRSTSKRANEKKNQQHQAGIGEIDRGLFRSKGYTQSQEGLPQKGQETIGPWPQAPPAAATIAVAAATDIANAPKCPATAAAAAIATATFHLQQQQRQLKEG